MVPSLTSVVIGGLAVALALGLAAHFWPPLLPWLGVAAGVGLITSGAIQLARGHRGPCWTRRTIRWWLGPIGSLVDPIDVG